LARGAAADKKFDSPPRRGVFDHFMGEDRTHRQQVVKGAGATHFYRLSDLHFMRARRLNKLGALCGFYL
jgi:hypothetical protein